ncbi:MAG: sec-independent protein translocase protein TatB [Crocinitomicaceae bacterium]|jgi:sec-independent protein translocase protein TatB
MFDIGFSELLVIGVLGLIILGPERLPKAARTFGLLIGRIRQTMSGIQQEIEQEVRNQDIRKKLEDPMHTYLSDDELQQREESEEADRMAHGEHPLDQVENSIHPHPPEALKTESEAQTIKTSNKQEPE